MPLDPRISLEAKAPDIYGAVQQGRQDAATNQITEAKVADIPRQQQMQQLADAQKKIEMTSQILGSAVDQPTYDAAKSKAMQLGLDVSQEPPVFDSNHIKQSQMALLGVKDKLELAMKQALNDARIGTEGAQAKSFNALAGERNARATDIKSNPGTGNGGGFGNSLTGKSYGILMNGNPSSPEYALAYGEATKPRYQQVQNADGTTQLVAVTPQLPDVIRKPGGAPNPQASPQGVLTPPVMQGATDATPTTQGPLLAPPPQANPRNYSVSPIAGTQGAASPVPAELAARLGLANDSLKQLPDYIEKAKKGDLTGPFDYAMGQAGRGEQGHQYREITAGTEALTRMLTGAGMNEGEAKREVSQYLPTLKDNPESLADKATQLQRRLTEIQATAMKGRGAVPSSTGNPAKPHPALQTPQAAEIKAAYQAGKMSKDQAKAALQALGAQ